MPKSPKITSPGTIGSRIDQIISNFHINLKEFAKKVHYSHSNISDVRLGKKPATNRLIYAICVTFNINEQWLRTGKGEMFIEKKYPEARDRETEINALKYELQGTDMGMARAVEDLFELLFDKRIIKPEQLSIFVQDIISRRKILRARLRELGSKTD